MFRRVSFRSPFWWPFRGMSSPSKRPVDGGYVESGYVLKGYVSGD